MDTFTFTTSDNDVGGTTNASPPESITGSVNETDVGFFTISTSGIRRDYTGKLSSDGATMSGTWTGTNTTSNTPSGSGTWSAIVHGSTTLNIAGDWNLSDPAAGLGTVTGFNFVQSINDLTGSTTLSTKSSTSIKGAIGGLDIMFFWSSDGVIFYTLTGKISNGGNTMSGTWTNTSGGSGNWSANRKVI
ncbi:MAG TPA: hypothetical protein VN328_06655 [Thermodesulfovibrionales bacterium]|nr:hypothetical protein [Thermodesulfovibrionales bacterium]